MEPARRNNTYSKNRIERDTKLHSNKVVFFNKSGNANENNSLNSYDQMREDLHKSRMVSPIRTYGMVGRNKKEKGLVDGYPRRDVSQEVSNTSTLVDERKGWYGGWNAAIVETSDQSYTDLCKKNVNLMRGDKEEEYVSCDNDYHFPNKLYSGRKPFLLNNNLSNSVIADDNVHGNYMGENGEVEEEDQEHLNDEKTLKSNREFDNNYLYLYNYENQRFQEFGDDKEWNDGGNEDTDYNENDEDVKLSQEKSQIKIEMARRYDLNHYGADGDSVQDELLKGERKLPFKKDRGGNIDEEEINEDEDDETTMVKQASVLPFTHRSRTNWNEEIFSKAYEDNFQEISLSTNINSDYPTFQKSLPDLSGLKDQEEFTKLKYNMNYNNKQTGNNNNKAATDYLQHAYPQHYQHMKQQPYQQQQWANVENSEPHNTQGINESFQNFLTYQQEFEQQQQHKQQQHKQQQHKQQQHKQQFNQQLKEQQERVEGYEEMCLNNQKNNSNLTAPAAGAPRQHDYQFLHQQHQQHMLESHDQPQQLEYLFSPQQQLSNYLISNPLNSSDTDKCNNVTSFLQQQSHFQHNQRQEQTKLNKSFDYNLKSQQFLNHQVHLREQEQQSHIQTNSKQQQQQQYNRINNKQQKYNRVNNDVLQQLQTRLKLINNTSTTIKPTVLIPNNNVVSATTSPQQQQQQQQLLFWKQKHKQNRQKFEEENKLKKRLVKCSHASFVKEPSNNQSQCTAFQSGAELNKLMSKKSQGEDVNTSHHHLNIFKTAKGENQNGGKEKNKIYASKSLQGTQEADFNYLGELLDTVKLYLQALSNKLPSKNNDDHKVLTGESFSELINNHQLLVEDNKRFSKRFDQLEKVIIDSSLPIRLKKQCRHDIEDKLDADSTKVERSSMTGYKSENSRAEFVSSGSAESTDTEKDRMRKDNDEDEKEEDEEDYELMKKYYKNRKGSEKREEVNEENSDGDNARDGFNGEADDHKETDRDEDGYENDLKDSLVNNNENSSMKKHNYKLKSLLKTSKDYEKSNAKRVVMEDSEKTSIEKAAKLATRFTENHTFKLYDCCSDAYNRFSIEKDQRDTQQKLLDSAYSLGGSKKISKICNDLDQQMNDFHPYSKKPDPTKSFEHISERLDQKRLLESSGDPCKNRHYFSKGCPCKCTNLCLSKSNLKSNNLPFDPSFPPLRVPIHTQKEDSMKQFKNICLNSFQLKDVPDGNTTAFSKRFEKKTKKDFECCTDATKPDACLPENTAKRGDVVDGENTAKRGDVVDGENTAKRGDVVDEESNYPFHNNCHSIVNSGFLTERRAFPKKQSLSSQKQQRQKQLFAKREQPITNCLSFVDDLSPRTKKFNNFNLFSEFPKNPCSKELCSSSLKADSCKENKLFNVLKQKQLQQRRLSSQLEKTVRNKCIFNVIDGAASNDKHETKEISPRIYYNKEKGEDVKKDEGVLNYDDFKKYDIDGKYEGVCMYERLNKEAGAYKEDGSKRYEELSRCGRMKRHNDSKHLDEALLADHKTDCKKILKDAHLFGNPALTASPKEDLFKELGCGERDRSAQSTRTLQDCCGSLSDSGKERSTNEVIKKCDKFLSKSLRAETNFIEKLTNLNKSRKKKNDDEDDDDKCVCFEKDLRPKTTCPCMSKKCHKAREQRTRSMKNNENCKENHPYTSVGKSKDQYNLEHFLKDPLFRQKTLSVEREGSYDDVKAPVTSSDAKNNTVNIVFNDVKKPFNIKSFSFVGRTSNEGKEDESDVSKNTQPIGSRNKMSNCFTIKKANNVNLNFNNNQKESNIGKSMMRDIVKDNHNHNNNISNAKAIDAIEFSKYRIFNHYASAKNNKNKSIEINNKNNNSNYNNSRTNNNSNNNYNNNLNFKIDQYNSKTSFKNKNSNINCNKNNNNKNNNANNNNNNDYSKSIDISYDWMLSNERTIGTDSLLKPNNNTRRHSYNPVATTNDDGVDSDKNNALSQSYPWAKYFNLIGRELISSSSSDSCYDVGKSNSRNKESKNSSCCDLREDNNGFEGAGELDRIYKMASEFISKNDAHLGVLKQLFSGLLRLSKEQLRNNLLTTLSSLTVVAKEEVGVEEGIGGVGGGGDGVGKDGEGRRETIDWFEKFESEKGDGEEEDEDESGEDNEEDSDDDDDNEDDEEESDKAVTLEDDEDDDDDDYYDTKENDEDEKDELFLSMTMAQPIKGKRIGGNDDYVDDVDDDGEEDEDDENDEDNVKQVLVKNKENKAEGLRNEEEKKGEKNKNVYNGKVGIRGLWTNGLTVNQDYDEVVDVESSVNDKEDGDDYIDYDGDTNDEEENTADDKGEESMEHEAFSLWINKSGSDNAKKRLGGDNDGEVDDDDDGDYAEGNGQSTCNELKDLTGRSSKNCSNASRTKADDEGGCKGNDDKLCDDENSCCCDDDECCGDDNDDVTSELERDGRFIIPSYYNDDESDDVNDDDNDDANSNALYSLDYHGESLDRCYDVIKNSIEDDVEDDVEEGDVSINGQTSFAIAPRIAEQEEDENEDEEDDDDDDDSDDGWLGESKNTAIFKLGLEAAPKNKIKKEKKEMNCGNEDDEDDEDDYGEGNVEVKDIGDDEDDEDDYGEGNDEVKDIGDGDNSWENVEKEKDFVEPIDDILSLKDENAIECDEEILNKEITKINLIEAEIKKDGEEEDNKNIPKMNGDDNSREPKCVGDVAFDEGAVGSGKGGRSATEIALKRKSLDLFRGHRKSSISLMKTPMTSRSLSEYMYTRDEEDEEDSAESVASFEDDAGNELDNDIVDDMGDDDVDVEDAGEKDEGEKVGIAC